MWNKFGSGITVSHKTRARKLNEKPHAYIQIINLVKYYVSFIDRTSSTRCWLDNVIEIETLTIVYRRISILIRPLHDLYHMTCCWTCTSVKGTVWPAADSAWLCANVCIHRYNEHARWWPSNWKSLNHSLGPVKTKLYVFWGHLWPLELFGTKPEICLRNPHLTCARGYCKMFASWRESGILQLADTLQNSLNCGEWVCPRLMTFQLVRTCGQWTIRESDQNIFAHCGNTCV